MIYLLHSTASGWQPDSFIYRNVVPAEALERFLATRSQPFVDLEQALVSGDGLTVDDGTRGGAAVCRLARRHGHAVTFFINPFNVATSRLYFFAPLNVALDMTTHTTFEFEGRAFPLTSWRSKRVFRTAFKKSLLRTGDDESMQRGVATICGLLGIPAPPVPDHLQSLSRAELLELRDLGVRIENHGWTHIDIAHATPSAITEHLERGRSWLRDECGIDSFLYATPFGESDLPPSHVTAVRYRFLAAAQRPQGQVRERCWNRRDLDLSALA
jgi:hypothetical protein